MNQMELAEKERAEFAALIATLTPQQWQTPTLCAGWTVHDVVAHAISYDELTVPALLGRLAKGLFSPDRANAIGLADYRTRTPEQLVELFQAHLKPAGLPSYLGGMIALADATIHQQDIRRPLGLPRQIPAETLRPVLRTAIIAPVIRGFWRVRGVRLVATDLDFSYGSGPEASGPAESLLMVIAGRRGIIGELTGPGCATLAARIER